MKNSNLSWFLFFVLVLSFFSRGCKLVNIVTVRWERKPRSYSNIVRSETELPILRNEKFSLSLSSLYQSLGCDILCVNRPSLSSNWPQTKSYSHSLPQVRFDMNSLSPNIQISRSCSDRQSLVNDAIVITASLNFPRELISLCLALKLLF